MVWSPWGDEIAQDEAGGEGAEHDIQIEDRGDGRQPNEQQVHRADDHLGVGVGIGNDEPVHVAADALGDLRHGGGRHGDSEEREEDDHSLPGGPGREQKRHGDDGKQLTPGAVGDDLVPHPRAQDASLLQNGQKRAHGRGSERDDHGQAVQLEGRQRRPNGHDDERDGEGDRPGDGAALPLRAGEALRRYLVAGEKEQEGEAQIGQQVDGVGRLNGTEPVRAEQRPGQKKEHRLGNRLARNESGDDGARDGHQRYEGQRDQIDRHDASFLSPARTRAVFESTIGILTNVSGMQGAAMTDC